MPLGAEHGKGWSTDYMTLDIQTIQESPGRYVVFDKDLVLNPSGNFFNPSHGLIKQNLMLRVVARCGGLVREGQQWILKHYLRGGLISHQLSARYFFTGYERTRMLTSFRYSKSFILLDCQCRAP